MPLKWDFETEKRFQEKIQEDLAKFSRGLCLGLVFFFALFAIVDYFLQPPELRMTVFAIRVTAMLVLTFGYFHIEHTRNYNLVPYYMVTTTGGGMTLIAVVSDGYKSSYFFGVCLLIMLLAQLFSWSAKRMAIWSFSLAFTYIFLTLWSVHFMVDDPKTLTNVIAFTSGCSVIATWGCWRSDRLRRESFARLIEAESEQLINSRISQALNARNEFISIASHELKTPLTTLKSQSWLLNQQLKKLNIGEKKGIIQGYMERNDRQIKRLMRLIDDMLDLSRITKGTIQLFREPTNLSKLAEEAIERFSTQFLSAGIQLQIRIEPHVTGMWDQLRLEQVINNLFSNAVKYAPHSELEIRVFSNETEAILEVEDHGPGIKEAFREKIFERFERAEASVNSAGLGLGLYIAKQIIQQHGGRIELLTSKNHGAFFRIVLAKNAEANVGTQSATLGKPNLLV